MKDMNQRTNFTLNTGETKPFLTIEEQLSLLKSRGLLIEDENNAATILRRTNYYRLSGYSLSMRKEDVFNSDASFNKLYEIYRFDDAFRKIILSYVSPIEIAFRSYIAHEHSRVYGPLGYMNSDNFSNISFHERFIEKITEEISRSDDVFVHHHKTHKNSVFPLWVVIECASFGELSKLFKNLKPEDRMNISKKYCWVSREYVENWLQAMVYARNIAAHGGRFYGRWLRSVPVKLPGKIKGTIESESAFAVVFAIHKILPSKALAKAFCRDLSGIFKKYPNAKKDKLGFPNNWKDILEASR